MNTAGRGQTQVITKNEEALQEDLITLKNYIIYPVMY